MEQSAAELVRCMSVDRNRQGRIKANYVKSQFDNITHQIGRYREEPEDSESDHENNNDLSIRNNQLSNMKRI